jgi:mRNA interferase MazF
MNKWDIFLLAYPFTDLTQTKVRPAVVMSPNSASAGEDAVFIAITGNTEGGGPYDLMLAATDPEYPLSGLLCDSVIKVDKIFTLHKSLAKKKLGKLGPALQLKVNAQLVRFFELF